MDRRNQRRRRGGPISGAVKLLATGIGLASESIKTHKEHKAAKAADASKSQSGDQGDAPIGPPPGYTTHSGTSTVSEQAPGDMQIPEPAGVGHTVSHNRSSPSEKERSAIAQTEEVGAEDLEADLEEEWALDEAQEEVLGDDTERHQSEEEISLEDSFLRLHPCLLGDNTLGEVTIASDHTATSAKRTQQRFHTSLRTGAGRLRYRPSDLVLLP